MSRNRSMPRPSGRPFVGTRTYYAPSTPSIDPPGAPTGVVATAGNAQASVAFVAPASVGGAPITSYTATSSPGGLTATGAASPLTVTGLTNATAYTFTVTAFNGSTGPASAASAAVTPSAAPTQVPVMTSNSAPSGVVIFSSESEAYYAAWKAFDGTTSGGSTSWMAATTANEWVGYEFVSAVSVRTLELTASSEVALTAAPANFRLEYFSGSWQTAYTGTAAATSALQTFSIPAFGSFTKWRVYCVNNQGNSTYVGLGEVQFKSA